MNNPRSASSSRGVAVIVGGIVLVCLLAFVAAIATNSGDDAGTEADEAGLEQQRPVNLSGASLPELGAGADPAVGTSPPAVEGQDFAGNPITIAPDGTPRLVMFLAHWCPHCQAEVPRLVTAFNGRDVIDGVELVAVATSTDEAAPNYPPSAWLADEGWPVPTIADDVANHTAEAFGLPGFPYYVALDAEGRVAARASGELSEAEVEALLATARGA